MKTLVAVLHGTPRGEGGNFGVQGKCPAFVSAGCVAVTGVHMIYDVPPAWDDRSSEPEWLELWLPERTLNELDDLAADLGMDVEDYISDVLVREANRLAAKRTLINLEVSVAVHDEAQFLARQDGLQLDEWVERTFERALDGWYYACGEKELDISSETLQRFLTCELPGQERKRLSANDQIGSKITASLKDRLTTAASAGHSRSALFREGVYGEASRLLNLYKGAVDELAGQQEGAPLDAGGLDGDAPLGDGSPLGASASESVGDVRLRWGWRPWGEQYVSYDRLVD